MEIYDFHRGNVTPNMNFNFVDIRRIYLPFACLVHSIGFDFP